MRQDRAIAAFRNRLRYRFDNALSRGPVVVIAYLGLLTLVVVLMAGVLATAAGLKFADGEEGFTERAYQSLLRMLDPGTFSGDAGWALRALTLLVTVAGVILGGSLIGLIANGVDQRVNALQRGRGRIVESGHTLILGWSAQVPKIVTELVTANESQRSARVVILADADKLAVEEALRELVPDRRSTRIVVRNGEPASPHDLERVCATAARSIIAVRGAEGDAGVIKAVLAVRALDPGYTNCHVVAELDDDDDARLLQTVSDGRVITVSTEQIVAEVTAQACHQPGLASVFTDLLDFANDEFYFATAEAVVGRSYAEVLLAFETSSLVGTLSPDGAVWLNPPADTVIQPDDRLILVAADDSAITFTGFKAMDMPEMGTAEVVADRPAKVLIVGWSHFGLRVLQELDEFLLPGSSIRIQVDSDLVCPSTLNDISLDHATLNVAGGRGGPEDFAQLTNDPPQQVILLAYRDALSTADADARTLLSLLALRRLWPLEAPQHVRVVAELVDQRNAAIAAPAGSDDLIISDALSSMMMAQLSERAELSAVFDELFRPTGPVVLLLAADQLADGGPQPFANYVIAAGRRGASAIGYRVDNTGAVVLNPAKSAVVELGPSDAIVAVSGSRATTSVA